MHRSVSLFVFIDAFGWKLLERHPFLDDVLSVRRPLDTVLGYSSTCDPTILTGLAPREHGHFAFYAYAPDRSPFGSLAWMRILPRSLTDRGRVRHHLSRVVGRALGYRGYFQLYAMPFGHLPLFEYTETRDIYQPGGINGGQPTVFDHLRGADVPFHLSDWRRPESTNLADAERALASGESSFAYVYLAAMDAILHRDGTTSESVAVKIREYDLALRRLLSAAQRGHDEVRLFVFSDHGMTDVVECHDLLRSLNSVGLRFGVDYVAVFDSTMARFWYLRDDARERIRALCQRNPFGRLLTADELEAHGCDFPGDRYGEDFFLLDPGVLLCPSHLSTKPVAGMHGYDPAHEDSVAMYASNVESPHTPRGLADLHDLMMAEAGLSPRTKAEPSAAPAPMKTAPTPTAPTAPTAPTEQGESP